MKRFKSLLRNAIAVKSEAILLKSGEKPYFSNKDILTQQEEDSINEAWLSGIFDFLFQNSKEDINSGEETKGILKIPNLGKIYFIAKKSQGNSFLKMFIPPNNEALFEKEWQEIQNKHIDPVIEEKAYKATPLQNIATPESIKPLFDTRLGESPPAEPENISTDDNSSNFDIPYKLSYATQKVASHEIEVDKKEDIKQPEDSAKNSLQVDFAPHEEKKEEKDILSNPLINNPIEETPENPQNEAIPFSKPVFTLENNLDDFKHQIKEENKKDPITTNPQKKEYNIDRQNTVEPVEERATPIPTPFDTSPSASFNTPFGEHPKTANASKKTHEDDEIEFLSSPPGEKGLSNGENPIDHILKDMISKEASDLHLTINQPIIYRIHGHVERVSKEIVTSEQMKNYLWNIIPEKNKIEFKEISDTDFAYEVTGLGRFRVNIFRDHIGVGAVLRHIPSTVLTTEQLKVPKAIVDLCKLSKGLVLVTGPTGSGKSTTLASMIDYINKTKQEHILTIEDPIEFVHKQQSSLINQREVGKHTKSFSRALKAALREDPDVVLIGEMRDLETIHIAIETAETGHLVFGTLHTTTAISTIDRIIDQFPSDQQSQIRTMLASSLKGVIAQSLLRKKSGGRVAAHEILVVNDAVSAMIREQKNHMIPSHMQTQKKDGNILLNDSLLNLVISGEVDFQEAWNKAIDKKGFEEAAQRKGVVFATEENSLKGA